MYINEDIIENPYAITAYDAYSVTVGNMIVQSSFILFPDTIVMEFEPHSFDELAEHHLTPILDIQPELLIIGTGSHSKQLSGLMRYCLESQHIGVECMNTPAACRSYSVLLAEGRRMAGIFFL